MRPNLLALFFILGVKLFAQNDKGFVATKNASQSLQIAQQYINDNQFEKAYRQLQHTIKVKANFAIAYRELGKVCFELKKYSESVDAYEKSFEFDKKLSRAAFFECGEACFYSGNIEKASSYYEQYEKLKGTNYANREKESGLELTFDKLLDERKNNCAYIAGLGDPADLNPAKNLGASINTESDEYLPAITGAGDQLIFTRQKIKSDEDIMSSKLIDGNWSKSKPFGKAINTRFNEGMAKFETHGKAFYFAGCARNDSEGGCDIYKAKLENGEVTHVNKLEGNLNSEYWDSQPSITCDGRFLYFSSSRNGENADIWMSRLKDNGEWSAPENLGSPINTEGDEEAPFISNDGLTLYFTSNGHPGQGEGDIFMSRKVDGKWTTPVNLNFPVNSPAKELGFFVQGDGKTAYFASAKSGGEGGLDIYTFELPEQFRPHPMVHFEGWVKDSHTLEPVSTKVVIMREDEKWVTRSDENGWFFTCLAANKGYSFQIDKPGYQYLIDAKFVEAQDNTTPVTHEFLLEPIHNADPKFTTDAVQPAEKNFQVFFDFDSHAINSDAVAILETLAHFLRKDEHWKVEIIGFADASGKDEYNKSLSQKRADAIVDFLKKAGIDTSKVVHIEGKGAVSAIEKNDSRARRVDVVLKKK